MEDRVDPVLVGIRLRGWRDERNSTGTEISALVENKLGHAFSWADLRPMEAGQTLPDNRQAEALVAVFGKTIAELLGPPSTTSSPSPKPADPPRSAHDTRARDLRERSPHRPGRPSKRGADDAWDLRPGDQIKRTKLHDRYGGGRQGGIAPSRESPNVLVFSDPNVGREHGYFDRWESDDVFLYCGEGQQGDQQLNRGNGAILRHHRDGRALRLFEGCRGVVRYAGEFEVDHSRPYTWETAKSSGGGPQRRVVMFRLVPMG